MRGVDSLGRRMQERAAGNPQGQSQDAQGRDGQQGQQAEGGQQGQEGQEGQQGKAGQQGQSGQGQGQQQGQAGQGGQQGQGQQSQGGQQGQARQGGGNGDRSGGWNDDGGWGNARPGNLGADDVRQFRGEARRYGQDVEALRKALSGRWRGHQALDDILRQLKALDDDRVYKNVQELAGLQAAVSEGLRRFEFDLRRKVEGETSDVRLTGSDDVPAEFKSLVEEYYRSLARPKAPQK